MEEQGDIPPLVMNIEEFNEIVEAAFDEKFGGYNPCDNLHVLLRRKLAAGARSSVEDDSIIALHGETAELIRQWLKEHGR